MFIPRTLSEVGRPGSPPLWRAIGVTAVVAAALFLILCANITLGQENLEAGQIAERDDPCAARRHLRVGQRDRGPARGGGGRGGPAGTPTPSSRPLTTRRTSSPPTTWPCDASPASSSSATAAALDAAEVTERLATDVPEIRSGPPGAGGRHGRLPLGGGAHGGRAAWRRRSSTRCARTTSPTCGRRSATSSQPTSPRRSAPSPATWPRRTSSRTS